MKDGSEQRATVSARHHAAGTANASMALACALLALWGLLAAHPRAAVATAAAATSQARAIATVDGPVTTVPWSCSVLIQFAVGTELARMAYATAHMATAARRAQLRCRCARTRCASTEVAMKRLTSVIATTAGLATIAPSRTHSAARTIAVPMARASSLLVRAGLVGLEIVAPRRTRISPR